MKKTFRYLVPAVLLACTACGGERFETVDRPDTSTRNAHYVSNLAPLQPQYFIPLPMGSVRPAGWVARQLELQAEGLNGHLGEISIWLEKEHNAWLGRGTANGILTKTVRTMQKRYGARPQDIQAVIGPSIHACCFETDADVPDAMRETMGRDVERFIEPRGAKFFIDLQGINRMRLQEAGVRQVTDSGLCTKCRSDEFWSHRATGGKRGGLAAFLAVKPKGEDDGT